MKRISIRRIVVAAFVMISALQLYAYTPMLETGNRWIARYRDNRMGHVLGHEYYQVTGDTLLAGKKAKVIENWFVPGSDTVRHLIYGVKPYRTNYYLLEEDSKIYKYTSDGSYVLMMDFGSPVGTKYYWKDAEGDWEPLEREYTIAQIDTITMGLGWQFRRITLKSKSTPHGIASGMSRGTDFGDDDGHWYINTHEWIEGVGALQSNNYLCSPVNENIGYIRTELEAFIPATNNPFFDAEAYEDVPKAAITRVEADPQYPADGKIYDLEGRAVEHPVAGHIYIRDGRKIVWRD